MKSREIMKQLFLAARQPETEQDANKTIGMNFLNGINNFPVDLIAAKRHLLKSILVQKNRLQHIEDANDRNNIIDILTGSETAMYLLLIEQRLSPDYKSEENIETELTSIMLSNLSFSLETIEAELSQIENRYGISSTFEQEIFSAASLKILCMDYVITRVTLFRDTSSLPIELKQELINYAEKEALEENRHQPK